MKDKQFDKSISGLRDAIIRLYIQGLAMQVAFNAIREVYRTTYLERYGYGFKRFIPTNDYMRIIKVAIQ